MSGLGTFSLPASPFTGPCPAQKVKMMIMIIMMIISIAIITIVTPKQTELW